MNKVMNKEKEFQMAVIGLILSGFAFFSIGTSLSILFFPLLFLHLIGYKIMSSKNSLIKKINNQQGN
jgi:hypothetical protein